MHMVKTTVRPESQKLDGKFATALRDALEAKGWSILHFAQELDATYEHIRKMVHGLAFPSKHVLKLMAQKLDLDLAALTRMVTEDKLIRKFGSIPYEIAGKSKRVARAERVIESLTDDQFNMLMNIAEGMKRGTLGGR